MKRIRRVAKLELTGGEAKPGPELASLGINMPQFCLQFNDASRGRKGTVVPVLITTYSDKSFDFVLKTTPTAVLLKQAAKVEKGAANAKTTTVASISPQQLSAIAQEKLIDLNTTDLAAACRVVAGTARQMGVKVTDQQPDKQPITG